MTLEVIDCTVVLAIDPGITTGIAVKTYLGYNTSVVRSAEEVWEYFRNPPTQCIIENFAAELISKYGLHTVRLVGGVTALCHINNVPIKIQQPQYRIAFVKPARDIIKGMGYKFMVHEVDALAHLLAWEFWSAKGVA